MLEFTGHPLFDVGLATVLAFVKKTDPRDLNDDDLDRVAEYIKENYVVDPLKSFLNVAFPNSGFTQAAYSKTPEKRIEYADHVLVTARNSSQPQYGRCVITGRPVTEALSSKLPPGRAFRQHIPLITGENIINFHPNGEPGLPISGLALFMIQAMPLGSGVVGERLLVVHSDNNRLTMAIAAEFLEENRRNIHRARLEGSKELSPAAYRVGTQLVHVLVNVQADMIERGLAGESASITAYHMSNSGQGTALDIYHLPLEVTDFIQTALYPQYRSTWNRLTDRGWQITKGSKAAGPTYNIFYEDLLRLPHNSWQFIRTYLLRRPRRSRRPGDPTTTYSFTSEADLISWTFTDLFLRKVLRMDQVHIETLRNLGDRLAEYVVEENDRRFFWDFSTVRRYPHFRNVLIKANLRRTKDNSPPLFSFDEFVTVFETELMNHHWSLARDLILIRMIERLYAAGWIQSNMEDMPVEQEFDTSGEDE